MSPEQLGANIGTQLRFIGGALCFGFWMHSALAGAFMYFVLASLEPKS